MSVTQNLMAAGQWSLRLSPDTPQRILDQVDYFQHLAITQAPEDVRLAGDAVLTTALYVGVLRGTSKDASGTELSGAGMAIWLGDEDDKGAVLEAARTYTGATFTSVIADLLTGTAIHAGTISSVTGTYSGTHQYVSPRKAIDYVTSTMGAEWRVNGDGTLDAGLVSALYPATPRAGIFAKSRGSSASIRGLRGAAKLASDVQDFSTRVVVLANGTEAAVATGDADILVNPYVDLFGQPVKMTRLVSESTTSSGNADVRAQLQLNRFTGTRDAVTLNSSTHDVAGSLAVGEYAWVYDPDAGLYDNNNEVQWQGETLNAALLRVTSLTWPVEDGRGVYLRTGSGTWLDLTPYARWESGQTTVVVGGYNRSLVSTGAESVWQRTATITPDTSVPGAPAWVLPFTGRTYQSPLTGVTRARIALDWTQPTNADASPIIDGDFYEIRFRTTTRSVLPATHSQMAGYAHSALVTHDSPIPIVTGEWEYRRAPWDASATVIQELEPGNTYEFQVRAVDNATPPNFGAWSTAELVVTTGDDVAPETPAAPVAFGNPVSVQVTHRLGKAGGGDFTLDPDLNHLEIHLDYEPTFEPRPTAIDVGGTFAGNMSATHAEINGAIPVVRTVTVAATGVLYCKVIAVDHAGNRSRPSAAAAVTPGLIQNQHIDSLTATKITAGTLTAAYTISGMIATGFTAGTRRAYMTGADGFYCYDENDALTFWAGSNGRLYGRGEFVTGLPGAARIEMDPDNQLMSFYPGTTQQHYELEAFTSDSPGDPANTPGIFLHGINSLGQAEGAAAVFYEDGWSVGIDDAGGTTRTGGYIAADRGGVVIGYEDTGATTGWGAFLQDDGFWIQSRNTGAAGALFSGNATSSAWSVRTTGGISRTDIRLDILNTGGEIGLFPDGDVSSQGYMQVKGGGGITGSSPHLKLMTGFGSGTMLRSWDNSAGAVNLEVKRWDNVTGATINADAFVPYSDESGKSDIRDAEPGALAKIKGTKAKRYRRKGFVLGKLTEDDFEVVKDANGNSERRVKPEALKRSRDEATDGPERLGLLAQEAPSEMQVPTSEGLGIDLYAMTTMAWQGVQEVAAENESLRAEVDTLKTQVADLIKAVDKLTKKG